MSKQFKGTTERTAPLVWALLGHRTGDNLQVETLADVLGWPWVRKELRWRRRLLGWTPRYGRMGPSLQPLEAMARTAIQPPWPDLVISIGWRSVPVARWIGRESGAKLAHIGRPRAPLDAFELVLTTPQYQMPDAPNVTRLDGPMTRLSAGILAAAAEHWRDTLAHLPRPWIAVLVGGNAPPLRLTPAAAAELGAKANALARQRGGSLLIATGPRTGRSAAATLLARIDAPCHSYIWGTGGENPYHGYLALADEIVVTADSISMVHGASLTGKPMHLFDLPAGGSWLIRGLQWIDRRLGSGDGGMRQAYRDLIRYGWIYPPRMPEVFHERLIGQGAAVRLGEPARAAIHAPDPSGVETAAEAVRRMMGL